MCDELTRVFVRKKLDNLETGAVSVSAWYPASMSAVMPLPRLPALSHIAALAGLVVALGLLVYGTSLGNGFVQWDDPLLITDNPAVRVLTPASLWWIATHYDPELYIPLTFFSYQIDWLIGGGSPMVFHLHSLALHCLNALLVAWLLLLLGKRRSLAAAGGLLFLVHPLHTEAVAWASGRKDVLSALLFLASFITYLYARERHDTRLRWGSVGLFALSLLAKVMTATLPVLLLLTDAWQGRLRGIVKRIWPYMILAIALGIVAIGGKTTIIERSGIVETLLMAARALTLYLRMFLWPAGLSVLYPHVGPISIAQPVFFLPLAVVVALAAIAILLSRRIPGVTYGLAWFVLTAAPTFLNFAKDDLYVGSDRYAYLPSIGLLIALLSIVSFILDRLPAAFARNAGLATCTVVLCALSIVTRTQSLVWHDTQSLFEHVLSLHPDAHVAHVNLGNAYRRKGDDLAAITEFEAALEIRPHARTEANLGAVYRKLGRFEESRQHYERAIALDPQSPESHMGLGLLLASVGRAEDAEAAYRTALSLQPSYGEAAVNLAVLLDRYGRTDEAIALLEQATTSDPLLADAHYNLAILQTKIGAYEEAIDSYGRAIHLSPTTIATRINLALLLAQQEDTEGAIQQFRAILRIDPDNAAATSALRQLGVTP